MPEALPSPAASLAALSALSGALLLVALAGLPRVLARLPEGWFEAPPERLRVRWRRAPAPTALRVLGGGALVVAGAAMLVLPGQGLLTLAVGLLLLDLPLTRRLAVRLARRPAVGRALQRLRARAGQPPFTGLTDPPGAPHP